MGVMTGFRIHVFRALQEVPEGEVITTPDLAKAANTPGARNTVFKLLGNEQIADYPFWRVVTEDGKLIDESIGGIEEQRAKLEQEGVAVDDDQVDLDQFGWTPEE